jgi:LPS O-antigen subunit length determinant protein (WzzB/FepE family)
MSKELTTREAYADLVRYFQARRDLGLWKASLDLVLDPQNPFEPTKRREPRRAFVLAVVLIGLPLAALFYFNCWL